VARKQGGEQEPRKSSKTQVPPGGGEGDRESDRRYREAAGRFAESGRVEEAAQEAEAALEGEEAEELHEAEERGRAPARD
jgi:hypothetical protein